MKRILLFAAVVAVLAAGCGRRATVKEINLVPQPVFMVQKEGSFTLKSNPRLSICGIGQNSATLKYMMASLRHARIRPSMVATGAESDIELIVLDTANPEIGDEGYLLEVRTGGIRISANTERGLFYAYQTLLQLLPPDISKVKYSAVTLPECTILDYPRFEWRGAHLDVCRHYFPVKFIKRYLDVMAMYKLNRFHWHLTDDHGWRLPSEKYPLLNTIGSWRVDRDNQPWGEADPPREGERATYGGYYSREDIADIVQYAAERGIEVVPELELPGHCSAILAAYPQLACDDYPYTVAIGPYWPPKAILCAGNDSVLVFIDNVVEELCDLFPQSRYIHLGGDEAFKDNWEQCSRCQRRIRSEHLRNEEELQAWLMSYAATKAAARGKQVIGWDEVMESGGRRVESGEWRVESGERRVESGEWRVESGEWRVESGERRAESGEWSDARNNSSSLTPHSSLGADFVVMAWRGVDKGLEAAMAGHQVVMCPTEYCYLDYYQANPLFQPKAIGGNVTLAKAYSFEPVPEGTPDNVARNILGGQCNLWTEFINTPQHAEYMLLPRMLAISECLWTPREQKDWGRFRRNVEEQKERLAAKGYSYCEGSFQPLFTARLVDERTMNIAITTEVPNTYIFYTTDSTTPTRKSPIYLGPINLERGTYIKILPVYKDQERDTVYEYIIK